MNKISYKTIIIPPIVVGVIGLIINSFLLSSKTVSDEIVYYTANIIFVPLFIFIILYVILFFSIPPVTPVTFIVDLVVAGGITYLIFSKGLILFNEYDMSNPDFVNMFRQEKSLDQTLFCVAGFLIPAGVVFIVILLFKIISSLPWFASLKFYSLKEQRAMYKGNTICFIIFKLIFLISIFSGIGIVKLTESNWFNQIVDVTKISYLFCNNVVFPLMIISFITLILSFIIDKLTKQYVESEADAPEGAWVYTGYESKSGNDDEKEWVMYYYPYQKSNIKTMICLIISSIAVGFLYFKQYLSFKKYTGLTAQIGRAHV